jgi:lysophospholipase L1-like esterase
MLRKFALALALLVPASAAPVKILAIGDSITDEYGAISELGNLDLVTIDNIYPEPSPPNPDNHPRAVNWPELLEYTRPGEADFGTFGTWTTLIAGFPVGGDLRYKGYQYNFGIVSTTTTDWTDIINGTNTGGSSLAPFFPATRNALVANLPLAEVVVIFLGGNDLKNDYNDLFNNTEPPGFLDGIVTRLNAIHGFVRSQRPSVPIVVTTVPDVGATPNVHLTYNTPANRLSTRAKIAAMNQEIVDQFSAKAATAVARIDHLTDDILDIVLGFNAGPFGLNGTDFIIGSDPYNAPRYLFCKDAFHPHTVSQALIANEIITAINGFLPGTITPFSNREILATLLLNPDQPYLDWVAPFLLTAGGPDDDPDGDGIPNLVEMTLGTSPDTPSNPLAGAWPQGLSWTPADTRYATLDAEESADLGLWTPLPPERLSISDGEVTATPPAGAPVHFLRLRATPRP